MAQGLTETHLAVASIATAGDAGSLYRLIARLMDEGTPLETVLFDVLLRVEREVGHRWQRGEYLVAEEHAVTATIETVVSLLAGSLDQPQDGVHVVLATVEGDNHSLPARALSAHLLFNGFRTTFLGASVLSSDLEEFLTEELPEAVVLSSAMASQLLGARAGIAAAHAAGVPVLVGGKGFGNDGAWAAVLGADAWAPTLRHVIAVLNSWEPDPGGSEAAAVQPSAGLDALVRGASAVMARAEAEWAPRIPGVDLRMLRGELDTSIRSLQAALLVGDPTPLIDALRWQAQTLPSHGIDHPAGLPDALAAALGADLEEAAAMLASARALAGV